MEGTSTGSSTYIINRRDMVEHLKKKNRWTHLVNQRMQDAYVRARGGGSGKNVKVGEKWRWDDGMADAVLQRLRIGVVRELEACLGEERRRLIMPLEDMDATTGQSDVEIAAILELRSTIVEEESEFWTIDHADKPIYDLAFLLREEMLSQLPALSSLQGNESSRLAILRHPRTVKLLLALDRLEAFVRGSTIVPEKRKSIRQPSCSEAPETTMRSLSPD